MKIFENKMAVLLIFFAVVCGVNKGFAAATPAASVVSVKATPAQNEPTIDVSQFPPSSIEVQAFNRRKELPNPTVVFPPFDIKAATTIEKRAYTRMMCPIYLKAYEELYLKKVSLNKTESPFFGFCARQSFNAGNVIDGFLLTPASFKTALDRTVVNFETSGQMDAAKERVEKFKTVEDLTQKVSNLEGQIKSLNMKMNQDAKKSGDGFLVDMGLSKGTATKTVEIVILVSLLLLGLVAFRSFQ